MHKTLRFTRAASLALIACLGLAQCNTPQDAALVTGATTVDSVRERGELVVLTLKGPTTYRKSAEGPVGYEVDMVEAFAEQMGVTTRYVAYPDIDALILAPA